MSFIAAAIIGGVGVVGGALIAGNAAKGAAKSQADAANQASSDQMSMFNTTQANFAPQVKLGQGAANLLGTIYGTDKGGNGTPNYSAFNNSPGYKFSLQQGEQAINKQAAANGSLYSSNTLGALNNYAQGTASTQYNSYINQLMTMAGLGNAASAGTGAAATTTGQGLANNANLAGAAGAAGQLGQANAFSNALGQAGGLLGNYARGGSSAPYNAGYNTAGGFVYNGVEQNGGLGGGIGNIVDDVEP